MDDNITKTIEKLQDVGASVTDTSLSYKAEYADDISVLELEKRARIEKQRSLEAKRNEAIKKLKEKGFPSIRPTLSTTDDFESLCPESIIDDKVNQKTRKPSCQLMRPLPEKPQNRSPQEITSYRGDKFNTPPETRKYALPIDEPFISDRLIRAREKARLNNFEEAPVKRTAISNVFPQMAVQDSREITGEDELARKYLYSSVYQTTYRNPSDGTKNGNLCRRIYPLKTLQMLPDPLRSIGGFSAYHPATSTWQPEGFNASVFDAALPRYDHMNEPRPYEFSTYAPRIDQITSYSGCHGTEDRRVEDDNPYKEYRPLNRVRRTVPGKSFPNLQPNIPGYTGCITDHVKEITPTAG
ncbi:hypothetical protein EG68_06180 [Paragonimus skrjabini miyazakii]|uniref:Uncharacterized protein n=1 Tax=Paragonimus skrjabini miyazakii TaxID=59628 RepID=A0A8S9YYZ2_9TREM|nr:hypothetical protein EG68_06180 [Paragonimus skrjabini miyazakii]